MKIKKVAAVLTVFEYFLTHLNKKFSSKKSYLENYLEVFLTASQPKHNCLLQNTKKQKLQFCSKCINYNLTKDFSDLISDLKICFSNLF